MLKINVGCGHTNFGKDWVSIDNINEPHISSHDIVDLLVDDNSVDVLYSSHTLEYFDREEALGVLKKWYDKVKVGGKIYLSVPDFRSMAELYLGENTPLCRLIGPLFGKMDSNGKQIYHKSVWDEASLAEYMRIAGFRRIDEWDHRDCTDLPDVDDCSRACIKDTPISLNLVGIKNEYEGKK